MKTKYLTIALLLVLTLVSVSAQENIPVVNVQQGELIGALPYGRHFYITGSTALPSGEEADSVVVQIFKTNIRHLQRNKKNTKALTATEKNFYTQGGAQSDFLVEKSTWVRYHDKDATDFRVYINKPLQFAREYIVEINYFRRYNFAFSSSEKEEILTRVTEIAQDIFETDGALTNEQTVDVLNLVVLGAMRQKVEAEGDNFYGFGKSLEENPIVNAASLEILTNEYLNVLGPIKSNLKSAKEKWQQAREDLDDAQDEEDRESAQEDIDKWSKRTKQYQNQIAETEKDLSSRLNIVRRQLALVSIERPVESTRPTAVTELDVIKVGTSFGGGGIFFNPQDADIRETNALAYTALKFYIFPVDKRIDRPYLSDFPFFNRTSILFGIVTSDSFNYRGQDLERPIRLSPMLGISYDVNRYFGIDLATTVFRQPSPSPLLTPSKTRFAPIIGLSFDFDIFNRIKSLGDGVGSYSISPTGN